MEADELMAGNGSQESRALFQLYPWLAGEPLARPLTPRVPSHSSYGLPHAWDRSWLSPAWLCRSSTTAGRACPAPGAGDDPLELPSKSPWLNMHVQLVTLQSLDLGKSLEVPPGLK